MYIILNCKCEKLLLNIIYQIEMAENINIYDTIGDNHELTTIETPLKTDAFEISDEEKNRENTRVF